MKMIGGDVVSVQEAVQNLVIIIKILLLLFPCLRATPIGVAKNRVPKAILLSYVLTPLNSIFVSMVGAKIGCHFNNSMFFR